MSEEDLMERLEHLYSVVNRARFFEGLGDNVEAMKLKREYMKLAEELRLSEKEVETMADELDDYYLAGKSSYEANTPLDHWLEIVVKRFRP